MQEYVKNKICCSILFLNNLEKKKTKKDRKLKNKISTIKRKTNGK